MSHQSLSQRANRTLTLSRSDLAKLRRDELQRLVYELQVHQVEQELQNEDLRRANLKLTQSNDRYAEFYDLAPVGYLTLNQDGKILSANLMAATMLGIERDALLGMNLSVFVCRDDDAFLSHRREIFSGCVKQTVELEMHKADGTPLVVRLTSIAVDGPCAEQCRTALLDITERKQVEERLHQLTNTLEQQVADRTAALGANEAQVRADLKA